MKDVIAQIVRDSVSVNQAAFDQNMDAIVQVAERIIRAFHDGNKVMLCGNGGSAADSQHIAAEFIGRFQKERPSLPAVALTTDTSILTALGNDYGFDTVFARQVEGIGREGDVLIGISTSGHSANVIKAVERARELNMTTVALLGGDGGRIKDQVDFSIVVPSTKTARIQESHICIAHVVCELVENAFSTQA